ncbi:hypothetical protein SynA1560_01862 [Synechococcus sp. A15-60]|nr:hypothetical protein SynA1560_01862 [Synechococcus sp. A15-60]
MNIRDKPSPLAFVELCCAKAYHSELLFLDHKHNDTTNTHFHSWFCVQTTSQQ